MKKNNLLRVTFFAGLLLLMIIGVLLAGAFVGGFGAAGGIRESAFHRMLREYDFKYRQVAGSGVVRRQDIEQLNNELDRLEKQAEAVESWLSILKRRRQLAALDSLYEEAYRQSSQRAVGAFPHAEPIAAIAAAALVRNAAITREADALLRDALPLLADSRFAPMRLSLHVLLGDFKSPEQALASLPRDFAAPEYFTDTELEREVIYPDLAILKILAGDIPSAGIDIQAALATFPSPGVIRLAAEYYYDFGDLLRAAALFSQLPDEDALGRQADALYLAGYVDTARAVWAMQTQNRALYNIAVTAPTDAEEAALLKQLVEKAGSSGADDAGRRFGIIRLSRLMDPPQAAALLEAEKGDPLIDLEWVKQRAGREEVARVIADTWLLLGRYPETEYLYEWGAWYMALHRNYSEAAMLLKIAARHEFSGNWVYFQQALQHIREGSLDAAADLLAQAADTDGEWAATATLGRVHEARLAQARALEQYQKALAVVVEFDDYLASRIQVRIAHCLRNMGRIADCRQALEAALEHNPDNLTARLELSRLK